MADEPQPGDAAQVSEAGGDAVRGADGQAPGAVADDADGVGQTDGDAGGTGSAGVSADVGTSSGGASETGGQSEYAPYFQQLSDQLGALNDKVQGVSDSLAAPTADTPEQVDYSQQFKDLQDTVQNLRDVLVMVLGMVTCCFGALIAHHFWGVWVS